MMLFPCFILILVVVHKSCSCPEEERLLHHLLRDREIYMPYSRPTLNVSHTLMLYYGVGVEDVEIDEERSFLDAKLGLTMIWTDEFFVWDPEDFEGLNVIRIPISRLWKPDIKLMNSFGNDMTIDQSAMAVVGNMGGVLWMPSATSQTRCAKHGEAWDCYLKFTSSTYDGRQLDLQMYGGSDIDRNSFVENRWRLIKSFGEKHAKQYPCCTEVYPEITYNITLMKNF